MHLTILNPGAMGVSIAAAAVSAGHEVRWVSEGRSANTRARAAEHGLQERATLGEALDGASAVISVCPPHAALDVASSVVGAGFKGLYVDGNAVSPMTMETMASELQGTGVELVDGGIVGPPAWQTGTTRLYLSGARASEVASLFDGSLVDARVVDGKVGSASALKMAYAAWTKGSDALLLGVRAMAAAQGVEASLLEEWGISQTPLPGKSEGAAARNSFKAWRFEGEMHEIADTFGASGLPDGFHRAAAEVYHRMAGFKDAPEAPSVGTVLQAINQESKESGE